MALVTINGIALNVKAGALLSDAIFTQHALDMPCAGYGRCGKCRVIAHGAISPLTDVEKTHLTAEEIAQGVRLACCTHIMGNCTILLSATNTSQICIDGAMPDFVHAPFYSTYGVAVDIGTTTLATRLYGPNGILLAQGSSLNPQAYWGADVISRVQAALNGKADLLSKTVCAGIGALLKQMAAKADIAVNSIDGIVITGNTAMLYLLTQTNPKCLASAPFLATHLFGETIEAASLHLPCHNALVYLPPCISAFIGADTTTALLASGICEKENSHMLVDIGTNGEIALWHHGRLSCCSTAAGPAFEGSGISMGMAGKNGAVDHVYTNGTALCAHVIEEASPKGICGSGVVDALACLLQLDQMDTTGILKQDPMPIASPVCLTQRDVRMAQLAKSAIRAGMQTLLTAERIETGDISELAVAGGFGSYLNVKNAGRIGLLPEELTSRTRVLGNAALCGAAMLLLNRHFIHRVELLAACAHTVDLSSNSVFMEAYIENILFSG